MDNTERIEAKMITYTHSWWGKFTAELRKQQRPRVKEILGVRVEATGDGWYKVTAPWSSMTYWETCGVIERVRYLLATK